MFAFFNKKQHPKYEDPEKSDEESGEEDEEEFEDKPLDIFSKPLCFQQWGDNIIVSYHFLSIRNVAPHLSSWCFNRKLDEKHKDAIKEKLIKCENPHLMGSIQIVRDKKMNCRIINGQHRIHVIQEIIKNDLNMEFQMQVMFEVYNCDIDDINDISDIASNGMIEQIFKIANNSLNMVPEQDHDILCKQIVIAMINDPMLKNGIIDKTSGGVYKPRICAKMLFEQFKSFLPSNNLNISVPEIIIRIKKINVKLSTMPFIELFGRNSPAQQKITQFDKAKSIGFYLNLNCKYTPDIWIEMLSKSTI